jgi:hypothetical protein
LQLWHGVICLLGFVFASTIVIHQILSIFVQLPRRGTLLHHKQITLHLTIVSN